MRKRSPHSAVGTPLADVANGDFPYWTSASGVPTVLNLDSFKKAEKLLRKGRLSIPYARYFVTCCTEGRVRSLTVPAVGEAIREAWRSLQGEGSINLRCATIMPDHIHLLFELGDRLRLAQVVGKFKSTTRQALKEQGLSWQGNYYDHRLRADQASETFSKYIFLNPYRSGLISHSELWPWWTCHRKYKPEFMAVLDDPPTPPEAWLHHTTTLEELIDQDTP